MSIVQLGGKDQKAIIDTGCSKTVLPYHLLPPGVELRPMTMQARAANNTKIEMSGEAELSFRLGKQDLTFTVCVSRQTEEFLLGHDWFAANRRILNANNQDIRGERSIGFFQYQRIDSSCQTNFICKNNPNVTRESTDNTYVF